MFRLIIKPLCLFVLSFFAAFAVSASESDWFMESPLQETYSALLHNKPEQAWHQLNKALAMEIDPPSKQSWQPVFHEILTQTQCGRALSHTLHQPVIKLVLIRRNNARNSVYQIKVSIEPVTNAKEVSLIHAQGIEIFSGNTSIPESNYSEIESPEMAHALAAGSYSLKIGDIHHPVIITEYGQIDWLKLTDDQQEQRYKVKVQSPVQFSGCPSIRKVWQWFDSKYSLVSQEQAFVEDTDGLTDFPNVAPVTASRISALIAQEYSQGDIHVVFQQRLTLPIHYLATEPQR